MKYLISFILIVDLCNYTCQEKTKVRVTMKYCFLKETNYTMMFIYLKACCLKVLLLGGHNY